MRPAKAEDSAALERDGLRDGLRVVRIVGRLRPHRQREERVPARKRVLRLARRDSSTRRCDFKPWSRWYD